MDDFVFTGTDVFETDKNTGVLHPDGAEIYKRRTIGFNGTITYYRFRDDSKE